MRIVYSLPHPAESLTSSRVGFIVRANGLLGALEELGHEIVVVEAASGTESRTAVGAYRGVVRRLLPTGAARRLRDAGRVSFGRRYGRKLTAAVAQHQPDVILQTHIAFSLAGKIASERSGVPLVLDDVTPAWEEEEQYGVGSVRGVEDVHSQVTQHARLLVAVNDTIRDLLVDDGVPSGRIAVVPNGVDERFLAGHGDKEARRHELGFERDHLVVVFVGSFQPYHRVDLLLEALASRGPSSRFRGLLVGGGSGLDDAKALARNLGLTDTVRFTGEVPYENIPSYLAAADAGVMPATNQYGNPMKLYEYLAAGIPSVAPRQPTVTDVVTDGRDALLFEPGRVDELAGALVALDEDRQLRERLARAAVVAAPTTTWGHRAETLVAAMEGALRA